jgi:hypothetical protein
MEMLRRGLSTLDELNVAEARETEEVMARDREIPAPSLDSLDPPVLNELDLAF